MSAREENVLQPLKASNLSPDDWPSFNLKQVTVTSQKTGKSVSLLSAHQNNSVRVSGRLEAVDGELIHLGIVAYPLRGRTLSDRAITVRDRHFRDQLIELDQVITYAFAEYDDGSYGFWAAGKAGWFEIQSPAPSFKTIYTKMNEAASMFYMLADRLRRSHKKGSNISQKATIKYTHRVFYDYFIQRRDPAYPVDVCYEEAAAAFHEHRDFLITSMLEGQDGLDWLQTPMLNYFKLKFPDEYAAIEARVLRPVLAAQVNNEAIPKDSRDSSRKRKSQSPHDESGLNKKQKRKAARQAESRIQMLPKGLLPMTPQASQTSEPLSSNEEDSDNVNQVGRKHKSILQPSGGKYSKKAAARRNGLYQLANGEDDGERSDDERARSEGSPITTLRTAKDLEILTNPPTNSEGTIEPKYLPRKYLKLKVTEYNLPSTEPQGPGDLWTCTFEGCFHRVHEASKPDGKSRIKDHCKTHASQAQENIDLVLTESRPYLPVNNLVRRLQAFAPAPGTEPGPESLERKFSAPIRKRY